MRNDVLETINTYGFHIVEDVFKKNEIDEIQAEIEQQLQRSEHVSQPFAIRSCLKYFSNLNQQLFTKDLIGIVNKIGQNYCCIKSLYFDKPPTTNWIVNWHQDLTIEVDKEIDLSGFRNWRKRGGGFCVQPPASFLKNHFTIRIHLDDCNKQNGALRVIPKSHHWGEFDLKNGIQSFEEKEVFCEVPKGGILIMKPLLLHSSRRTENQLNRRIIHLEFSNNILPKELNWTEKYELN